MFRKTILLIVGVSLTLISYTQTRLDQFIALYKTGDTLAQQQFLQSWYQSDEKDPELYVAYFNYYVLRAQKEVITIMSEPKGDQALQITTQDEENPEVVGYLGSDIYYEPTLSEKALEWIDRGISRHPNRLDLRFGKTRFLGNLGDYESFTLEVIATMERIAQTILKYYPKDIYTLSNLSVVYTIKEEYDKAIEVLHKALKLAPKDTVIIGNLANNYKQLGDKENAIKYYEEFARYGDEGDKAYAAEMIKEIRK